MRWSATQDQRLLLLICKTAKISHRGIAEAWAREYSDDKEIPSERAIQEHLISLSKKVSNVHGPMKSATATPTTPRTPKVPTTPKSSKTPRSGDKRKHIESEMEYDSEPDYFDALSPSVKRKSIPRGSKSKQVQPYVLDSEDDISDGIKIKSESADMPFIGNGASSKKSSKTMDFADCESDVSEYIPQHLFN